MSLQIKELNSQGYEVILVSSGAVGLGRQRLRYRRLINSRSFFLSFFTFPGFFYSHGDIRVRGICVWMSFDSSRTL